MRIRLLRLLLPALIAIPFANLAGQASPKGAAPDPKGLVAPPKTWAAQVSPTEFNVVWGLVPQATSYEVLVRNASGQLVRLGTAASNATRYIVQIARLLNMNVAADAIEFYIRAYNGTVAGPLSRLNTVRVAKQSSAKALVAPQNVVARQSSPGVITVTWTDVPDATAYAIGRAVGSSGFQRFCDLCPTGGTLVDTVPTAGTEYAYAVTAVMPGGRSRSSRTLPVEVTRLATDSSGTVVATSGVTNDDVKQLVDGVSITARPLASRVVQISVNFAIQQGGIAAELVRMVCGRAEVIRTIGNLVPFNLDDYFGGLEFPECNGVRKQSVQYFVRIRNPKGAVAQSNGTVAEVEVDVADADSGSGSGAPGAADGPIDPKGLAAGITVSPSIPGGFGSPVHIAINIANFAQQFAGTVGQLMRRACDGPWIQVRTFAITARAIGLGDVVPAVDARCGTRKSRIQYMVRIADPKGLAADSKAGEVELQVPTEPEATEPPATPGNRSVSRTSDGRRTLLWGAVPGATGYRIERIAGAKGAWTVVQELPGTATSWTDRPPSSDARYRITATNRAGNSATGMFP